MRYFLLCAWLCWGLQLVTAQPDSLLAVLNPEQSFCPKVLRPPAYTLSHWEGHIIEYQQKAYSVQLDLRDSIIQQHPHSIHPTIIEQYTPKQQRTRQQIIYPNDSIRQERLFYYDKQGYLTRVQIFQQARIVMEVVLQYYIKEHRCEIVYTNENQIITQKEQAYYDHQHGKIVEYTHERLDETSGRWQSTRNRYSYSMSGRLIEVREYPSSELLSSKTTYQYNKDGACLNSQQEFYMQDGLLTIGHDYMHRFDSLRRQYTVKDVTCFQRGTQSDCNTQITVYQYDSIEKQLVMVREGKGTTSQLLEYDQHGNWTKRLDKTPLETPLLFECTFRYAPTRKGGTKKRRKPLS